MISAEAIERVVEATDIVQLVNQYIAAPGLRKVGVQMVGYCPFHQERTPSFVVHPGKGFYHCKGCGAGGNAINFIIHVERVSFSESVYILADRVGITIDEDDEHSVKRAYARQIAAEAAWWWRRVLKAYRDREDARWQAYYQLYLPVCRDESFDHDTRFFALSEAVRRRRSALRWARIVARAEAVLPDLVVRKYWYFRTGHPEIVRIYREHLDLEARKREQLRQCFEGIKAEILSQAGLADSVRAQF